MNKSPNVINANTKLATIIKSNPAALEAIISITPRFEKLRNPVLRRIMAARTTIKMASKAGGCDIDVFFSKLQPLGFVIDRTSAEEKEEDITKPDFMLRIGCIRVEELDVRPVIEGGKDPFKNIVERLKKLAKGEVLKLINSFEPTPLIQILKKEGYEYYVETIDDNEVHTYFYKETEAVFKQPQSNTGGDWGGIVGKYENALVTIDVRHMEMPQPMLTILSELEHLLADKALYVFHKRIPVFLLPELQERKFDYRIKEISDSEVHLIIFKA
ncbi:MAG: hypothetical protein BGO70_03320 [Bacteroidetes bacterium 43-93]|uniref:DUF2249 domain-containing protein n=1 Tax=uncultured Dysgonomonas sp. TaxID=206096 RepID=UPI000928B51D|nr:DUF2249 domain-containing protein [uncultured Dysgonomonas sp.]MBN9484024.1 DUF2249 domain-containing protein [Bacteroidota bacterium]OJW98930.1 MAG: hypothetical protein BGO70_03320 [Bacteroidetes bacterium 43-93]